MRPALDCRSAVLLFVTMRHVLVNWRPSKFIMTDLILISSEFDAEQNIGVHVIYLSTYVLGQYVSGD